jgi:hypothetical protein
MSSESDEETTQAVEATQIQEVIPLSDEEAKIGVNHWTNVMKVNGKDC